MLAAVLGGGRVGARLAPETVPLFRRKALVGDEVLTEFSCIASCWGRGLGWVERAESPSLADCEDLKTIRRQ